jgi:hypothetical protein
MPTTQQIQSFLRDIGIRYDKNKHHSYFNPPSQFDRFLFIQCSTSDFKLKNWFVTNALNFMDLLTLFLTIVLAQSGVDLFGINMISMTW